MSVMLAYRCSLCGTEYDRGEQFYTCSQDGGNLDVLLDYAAISGETSPGQISSSPDGSMWRYADLLPVGVPEPRGTPLHSVGWSPLFRPERLAEGAGHPNLWLKDDGRNPTASFKDRASAVVVARAREINADVVVTASTGNAGAALAGMAAAAGVPAVILAPRSAPQAKIAQLLIFGADVYLVDGSYDQAFDLSVEAAVEFGWYCRNTGYNPFTAEGKKTAAYEICEQFTRAQHGSDPDSGTWVVPDAVFVSVGDGNIISGLHKGFRDLLALGWIERIPRLFGVQAQGSAAIYRAFNTGSDEISPVAADTLADSISVDLPRDGHRALRAAAETAGGYIAVSDEEILAAMRDLAQSAGVFAEPAGAAGYAGAHKAIVGGELEADDHLLVLNTGNGLKDIPAAMQAAGEAQVIPPDLASLREAVAKRN